MANRQSTKNRRLTGPADTGVSATRRRVLQVAAATPLSAALAGCNWFGSDSRAGADYTDTIADGRAAIRTAMAETQTSSVSVALLDGSDVVWQEAFGTADGPGNVPANPDTMYNIGSVSKVFAATAVMVLVDRGLVELDAPLVTYVRDFSMLSPDYHSVTVRMLLCHASGFPGSNYQNAFTFEPVPGYARRTQEVLSSVHLKHQPGVLAVYCNDGFTMAERVVEEVSGKAYADFVTDEILLPLGMTHSRYPTEHFPAGSFARPYVDGAWLGQEFVHPFGSGGLSSTPGDMMRFAMMFLNAGELDGKRVLSSAAVQEMGVDTTTLLQINPSPEWKWGLGWDSVMQPGMAAVGLRCWQKNGGTAFFGSEFFVLPEQSLGLMITGTSLRYGSAKLAERILLHALVAKGELTRVPAILSAESAVSATVDQAALNGLIGYYGSYQAVTRVVAEGDGTLRIDTWRAGHWEAMASGLRQRSDGWFEPDGKPQGYRLVSSGGYHYLTARQPSGYGHYLVTMPLGERLEPAPALPNAWQARLGRVWLVVNEDASSVLWDDEGPAMRLDEVSELPGYVLTNGAQPSLPDTDTRTRMILKIPVNFGRDLNEVVIDTRADGEWITLGAHRYRPLAGVESLSAGTHGVAIGGAGEAQWRQLTGGGTLQVVGASAWRVYDGQWQSLAKGEPGATISLPVADELYLVVHGAPHAQITVTIA